jgi:secondary thiamine-phosphate synthase enzyme
LKFEQHHLQIETPGRTLLEISDRLDALLRGGAIDRGLCHLFIHHTSASLIVTENADGNVLRDLENYLARLAPDGDPAYLHDQEGPDDMAAHIRSVLTQCELTVPISAGRLALGTWQGVFVCEHRYRPHRRNITVTLSGP